MEVSNNRSVWDKNVVLKLDGHATIVSCLFKKSNEAVLCQWKGRLKQRNDAWRGMARDSAPGYPNKHIWHEKVVQNKIWRQKGHIEHNPIHANCTVDSPNFSVLGDAQEEITWFAQFLVDVISFLTECTTTKRVFLHSWQMNITSVFSEFVYSVWQ